MYFDEHIADIDDDPWQQVKLHAVETLTAAEKRLVDLNELQTAVCEQLAVLDMREADIVRQLHAKSEELVQQIRKREAELVSLLKEDCGFQRGNLEQVLRKIESKVKRLTEKKLIFEERERDVVERAEAQHCVVDLLQHSAFFNLPEMHYYVVTSLPITMDCHLTLVQEKAPFLFPSALTVPIKDSAVYIPLKEPPKGVSETCCSGSANNSGSSSMSIQPGILHYIATAGGTRAYCNPVLCDAVRVNCNAPLVLGELSDLCCASDEGCNTAAFLQQHCFRTASQEGTRLQFDFGDRRWVDCLAYSLRHGHASEHVALRSWKLTGSRDGVWWVVLDEQKNNNVLGRSPFNVATFAVDREQVMIRVSKTCHRMGSFGCAFRYIALEMTGPDALGQHHLELSGIELYGYLVDTICL